VISATRFEQVHKAKDLDTVDHMMDNLENLAGSR
jgi:hypothetical protein